MKKIIMLMCAMLAVSSLSAAIYSVTIAEYNAVGGSIGTGDLDGCAGSYQFERVDTITILPGTTQTGTVTGINVENCGVCPTSDVTQSVSTSQTFTNTSTKTVSGSISAGIGPVNASLDAGMSWAGSSITISGTSTVGPVSPCDYQNGQFTYQYLGDKGKRINHDYTAYWVTSGGEYEGATTTCPYQAGHRIADGGASDSSDNVGTHYHQTTATYQSTTGGTCSGCTPG